MLLVQPLLVYSVHAELSEFCIFRWRQAVGVASDCASGARSKVVVKLLVCVTVTLLLT